jgi:CHASE3 domain sensor protein
MHCNQYAEAIQELADGTLGPVRRAELQTHLDQCDACRALAVDLRKIREAAASLDHPAPSERVWMEVAGRLRQEGRVVETAAPARRRMALLALAAALLVTVGGSLWLLYPMREAASDTSVASGPADPGTKGPSDPSGGNAASADPVQSVADEFAKAEQHLQAGISKLEAATKADQSAIDPDTAATLQKNLLIIDQAIAESRTALRQEPQSQPARDSLFEALRRKVSLLQDTIALMNEMRKGNSAGAAQIIDANKS